MAPQQVLAGDAQPPAGNNQGANPRDPRAAGGPRPAWRVKLVTARGEVRVVLVDAATGRPL